MPLYKYTQLTNTKYKMCISIVFIQYHTVIAVCPFVALKSVWMQKRSHAACVCVVFSVFWVQEVHVSCLTATVNVHWGCTETTDHQEEPHCNPLIFMHSEQTGKTSPAAEVTIFEAQGRVCFSFAGPVSYCTKQFYTVGREIACNVQ